MVGVVGVFGLWQVVVFEPDRPGRLDDDEASKSHGVMDRSREEDVLLPLFLAASIGRPVLLRVDRDRSSAAGTLLIRLMVLYGEFMVRAGSRLV